MGEDEKIILLIDPDVGEYCQKLLSILDNHHLIIKTNHRDAFEFFINNHFNISLVLLCHTPEIPCDALLRYLKLIEHSIPVIIITDHGSEELVANIFKMGASDYFKKSRPLQELKSVIASLLSLKKTNIAKERHTINNLYRGIDYINRNFCCTIRLCKVAKEAGMSVSCFERTFKKTMGINFSAYVNKMRIAMAVDMLRKTNYCISDIAFACGFTNQFHFSRVFKQIMKISPTTFKKSYNCSFMAVAAKKI